METDNHRYGAGRGEGLTLRAGAVLVSLAVLALLPGPAVAERDGIGAEEVPGATGLVQLAEHAWAWVAEDDRSSNGALFTGEEAALVVDPGLTPEVARRFFAAVRQVTDRPLRWVVLTHWHPDHALGAVCMPRGSEAGSAGSWELVAHPQTRRALAERGDRARAGLAAAAEEAAERSELEDCRLRLPEHGVKEQETFDLGGLRVEVFHPGAAHTPGDLVVWVPSERVLVTGDLFLHDSCPYMGEGSTEVWIEALARLQALEPAQVVPGHFAPGTAADLDRFRAYLIAQLERAKLALAAGETPETHAAAVARDGFPGFPEFAQYPQYEATFADNARVVAEELARRPARRGETAGLTVHKVLDVGQAPHQISFSADGRRAYVAAAGSDRITEVEVESLEVVGSRPVTGTPLGVVELPSGDLAVTRFRGGSVVRLPSGGGDAVAELATGEAPSLLVGPVPGPGGGVRYLVSAEGVDRLWVLDAETFELAAGYPTGDRPFPAAVTPDGHKAFVPAYNDGTVTVVDLWNGEVLATVAVGEKPSGGAVLPDGHAAVAVRGEDRLAWLDTASHEVTGELREGIGTGPFSVVVSPDGSLAFVNNTASHDVSVLRLGEGEPRVVARVPTGEIPIVMAVHPSGETLWVGCEGSHELWVFDLPEARPVRGPAFQPPPNSPANPHVVLVTELGEIEVEIYADRAPVTAANFLAYVDQGRFEGATFYRTVRLDNQPHNQVKIEVIQGGLSIEGDHPAALPPIPHETTETTGVRHLDGTISMARDEPGSASSEFFIAIGDQPELDFGGKRNPDGQGFAAFGRVVRGMDVVRKIQAGQDEGQMLVHPVAITAVKRVESVETP